MKKTSQLRSLINSKQLEFIMEAHNALSAKIVEEAGFKGIWASGLSISAAMGVRDNNEASWTQILEVLEFMSDATSIPILLDGDTGYGNFNNARRLVKKLEQRNIAGVCIEDKLFPKMNSFIKGEAQPLADIEEFCGKIKAMKDIQSDEDFVVISRVEAFIAGWGLDEALKRAEAYRKAGTDAILIHSKQTDMADIEDFIKEWGGRHPLVIVPTKYYSVPTDHFRKLNISLAIWANHNLRSSIKAMKATSAQIFKEESLINVEKTVTQLEEVFRLQGSDELAAAEKIYLTSSQKNINVIVLAAKSGQHPILNDQIQKLNTFGIKDVHIVEGYEGKQQDQMNSDVYSLYLVRDKIMENTIISTSKITYKEYVIEELTNGTNDITIVVDPEFEWKGNPGYFVKGKHPYSKLLYNKTVDFIEMLNNPANGKIQGEFIGLWRVSGKGSEILKNVLEKLALRKDFKQLSLHALFNYIQSIHPISIKYMKGAWLDQDTFSKILKDGDTND